MKGTRTESPMYPIYDLSNPHFAEVEIVTRNKELLKGQFVRFKVISGNVKYLYPSEKYCFLPAAHKNEFWSLYEKRKGEFKTVPSYIKNFSLNEIDRIVIAPVLVP